ncbi:uncharacterized protein LOC131649398 [Vicia villosa]|uniref:uncharacterized protein LOC131649398 n=1 Tax=Vicia villosa TaxID=3911 RepID=UPI00273CE46D|nr:uncharacterized protein LOC131649398 [Vicia villosa]
MDRSWMRANRISAEYEHGVMEYLQFDESNAKKDLPPPKSSAEESLLTLILCSCVRYANQKPKLSKKEIMNHLICKGFCQSYTQWIWYDEVVATSNVSQIDNVSVEMDDRLEDMMRDIEQYSFKRTHAYDSLYINKDTPLYPGCTNFTCLLAVLKLFNLKPANGWSDKSFNELLELLTQMLPEGNVMPSRYYEAKKILCLMGLEYEKIHACPNDSILYRKEYVKYNHCPKCKASRYKKRDGESSDDEEVKKGPPAKVVWYLPIISRFKILFANADDAKNLRWHAEERKCDGQIRHEEGVDVFDAHSSEQFNLRAMLFCTINDFLAYGNLSGYKVKGHKASPIYEKDTCYNQLEKRKNTVYLGHRKFLNRYHPHRRLRKAFNGKQEHGVSPKPLTREEVYQRQRGITAVFGKYQKRPIVKNIWKKNLFFFNLPYWSSLERLVSVKDIKLVGLKFHDCHVLMQQLLPVAIRGIFPNNVRKTITRLCLFFNEICCKAIDPLKLEDLENEAAVILCQLEMFFPPSFFNIMVHLIVHLVREIRLYSPIFLQWMYPIERYMKILKVYTKNPHRSEASIFERYIAEEAIEFCSNYLSEVNVIGVPKSRRDGRCEGVGTQGLKIKSLSIVVVVQVHLYILNNTDEVQLYLSAHKSIIKKKYPKMNERGLLKENIVNLPLIFICQLSVSESCWWVFISLTCIFCKFGARIDNSSSEVYGFMDPAMCIHYDDVPSSATNVRNYIQDKLMKEDRVCHLLPLIHG